MSTPTPAEEKFLKAMERGRHRRGGLARLRSMVAKRERELHGFIPCFCCGRSVSLSASTLEHIRPQSLGGRSVLHNLALSHALCNLARGNSNSPRAVIVNEYEVQS